MMMRLGARFGPSPGGHGDSAEGDEAHVKALVAMAACAAPVGPLVSH